MILAILLILRIIIINLLFIEKHLL